MCVWLSLPHLVLDSLDVARRSPLNNQQEQDHQCLPHYQSDETVSPLLVCRALDRWHFSIQSSRFPLKPIECTATIASTVVREKRFLWTWNSGRKTVPWNRSARIEGQHVFFERNWWTRMDNPFAVCFLLHLDVIDWTLVSLLPARFVHSYKLFE